MSQDPACPLQTLSSPASAPPTSWYMKHYAANQEDWIRDFAAAYDKMTSNGSHSVFINTYPNQQSLGYTDNSLTLMDNAMEAPPGTLGVEFTSQIKLDYSQYWTRGR